MKAIVCNEFAPLEKLAFTDFPDPVAGADEVVVDVKAAGVNYPDALIVQGKYQDKPALPFVPGLEFAGVVSSLGDNVSGIDIGARVIGFSPNYGAHAEKVACPAKDVFAIPHQIPFADAANLGVAHGTAHHAFKQRAQLKAGETVVVLGAAGGTGVAAVQIAKAMGARVIAACSSAEKLAIARENGADELINYVEQDLKAELKALTGGKGVDVAYDPVGGDTFAVLSRSMARNGRLLVIGFASGDIPKLPVNLALVKEYSLVGVFCGSFMKQEPELFKDNLKELYQWYLDGDVRVVTEQTLPLSRGVEALRLMMERKVKGKLVLIP